MEQNQDRPLFGLSIDPITKSHLSGAATWAKFLAIIGFILCGIIVLAGLFARTLLSSSFSQYENFGGQVNTTSLTILMGVIYILGALLYFFPCLFLYHFATKMKLALRSDDQEMLNASFQGLKKTFRFVGVLTIVFLSFYLLLFLFALAMGSSSM